MSRKHFEILADKLLATRPPDKYPSLTLQWNKDVQAIADACSMVNHRFDYNKFYTACGGLF